MMRPTVLILSSGTQSRFPDGWPLKQLLEFDGESLLNRQLRQLRAAELNPIVVTVHEQIKQQSPCWLHPLNFATILFTLESTQQTWNDITVVLLGDVYYGDWDFREIINCHDPLKFWTNGSEIFAISFTDAMWQPIREAITFCEHKEDRAGAPTDRRLWHLYRAMNGWDIHNHSVATNAITQFATPKTFDVDSMEQYEKMKQELTTHNA